MKTLVTPKLVEKVREMRSGGWYMVTNTCYVACRISGTHFQALCKLGWVEWTRQHTHGNSYMTHCWLNETGKQRAAEFDALSEVNS
jgi:hypothetical protein